MGKSTFTPDRIKVIFFDINETLFDPARTFRHAFKQVWEDVSARWETDGSRPAADQVWEAYNAKWRGSRAPGFRNESYADMHKRNVYALAAALAQWGLKLPDSALQSFFHKVNEHQEKFPYLYPGTAETLSVLSKSYKVAIISNGMQDKQTRRLRAAGQIPPLREDRMFFSAAVGVRKPHPAIFRHALERLGIRPDQAVMVGNSWSKDILGAVSVHMNAVWFRPGGKQKHFRRQAGSARIHVIHSMEQLMPLFEASPGTQQPSK
jgi:HAD superfamily hydrolase (TIGR01549 family)